MNCRKDRIIFLVGTLNGYVIDFLRKLNRSFSNGIGPAISVRTVSSGRALQVRRKASPANSPPLGEPDGASFSGLSITIGAKASAVKFYRGIYTLQFVFLITAA